MEQLKTYKNVLKEVSLNKNDGSDTLIKLSCRILSQLKEIESRMEVMEEIILELRRRTVNQNNSKNYEPIRGIHGLAEFLGVSPVTAQKLKNSGKIPYVQFERIVLFDPKRVMDALESLNYIKK